MTVPDSVSPNGARIINNRATTFLSRGIESLALRVALDPLNLHFDVVVIGSGYGGAVAANHFSACKIPGKETNNGQASVCVLERGKERLPGTFPTGFSDLPGELRLNGTEADTPGGNAQGLFEIRVGTAASAVVANGLGGGSLINAGVMLTPEDKVLDSWPSALGGADKLGEYYEKACRALGVLDASGNRNTIDRTSKSPVDKYRTLQQLAGIHSTTGKSLSEAVPITVALEAEQGAPVATDVCIDCGDCAQGCNHNAKKSLDTNLLAKAALNGAEIFTGATVLKFDKTEDGWEVFATYTDPTRSKRTAEPVRIRCSKLVVAAGTYASNELMFRSQAESTSNLDFSDKLGSNFSGNGDNIAAITNCESPVNIAADETVPPAQRQVGPTITGMIDLRKDSEIPIALQELSIPAALKGVLTEVIGFVRIVNGLTDNDTANLPNSDEICYVSRDTLNHTAILIMMGNDGASGRLIYNKKTKTVSLQWPEAHSSVRNQLYKAQISALQELAKKNLGSKVTVHDNPARNPLGEGLQKTMDIPEGPVMTVHPLGGCCIGNDAKSGVVNSNGEVFVRQVNLTSKEAPNASEEKEQHGKQKNKVYDGLVVLDGSIIPGAPGINPALSITALSLRAVENLTNQWGWQENQFCSTATNIKRPRFRKIATDTAPDKLPTKVALTERLIGKAVLQSSEGPKEVLLELSMQSAPVKIADYTNNVTRAIPLESANNSHSTNTIRIFDYKKWQQLTDPEQALRYRDNDSDAGYDNWMKERRFFDIAPDDYLDKISLFTANVTGNIELFTESTIPAATRLSNGFATWISNRGAREILNGDEESTILQKLKMVAGFKDMMPLWKHGGRKRHLTYSMYIQKPTQVAPCFKNLVTTPVAFKGIKTFRYTPKSNPWRQMSEIDLLSFPGLKNTYKPRLVLDLFYMARKKSPLLSIVQEDTLPDGYTDLTMFSMRFMRELLLHHFFSFMAPHDRAPDKHNTRHYQAQLKRSWPPADATLDYHSEIYNQSALPQQIRHLKPNGYWFEVDHERPECANSNFNRKNPNSHFLKAHLTHYPGQDTTQNDTPVLLIHGYSASGTTFAHPELKPGLAEYLHNEGKDVWVLDMRTSCALYSGSHPWTFEDMAFCDIPAAINLMLEKTGAQQVDIVAHCMGAVMLSIAILGKDKDKDKRKASPNSHISNHIRRIVLSQAGPVLKFSAANTFRAFMMHYLKNMLPDQDFAFFPALAHAKQAALNEGNYEAGLAETLPNGVTGADQMIDRLLATLPYPDEHEYRLEYPALGTSPFVRERHRMDILYGKTFSLRKMSNGVLKNLSDFFGPLSIETVKQTIYFANNAQITDHHGNKILRSTDSIRDHWQMPTLWIHGQENGLIDPISPVLTQRLFDEAGTGSGNFRAEILPYFGHQDSLMGSMSAKNYRLVIEHLEAI